MGASTWWCVSLVASGGLAVRWSGISLLGCLIRRLGSDRFCPGWDVAYFAAEAEDVAGTGGFLRVIIINTVVVSTQHR